MALETPYLKTLKLSQSLRLAYYWAKDFYCAFRVWFRGEKKVFLKPSSKTLKGLILLQEQQRYKRKT